MKMKITALLVLLLPVGGMCQLLGLSAGPSFPMGKFASIDPTVKNAWFAGNGFNLHADIAAAAGNSIFAFGGRIGYTINQLRVDELENVFNSLLGTSVLFRSQRSWSSVVIMPCMYVFTSTRGNLRGFARLMGGPNFITMPV
jgi:hypothetical protein